MEESGCDNQIEKQSVGVQGYRDEVIVLPPQQCCDRPRCLRNTFTAEIENGVWQGGLGFGTQPLRTNCFYPTADGDWFPITPRMQWTGKHCVCNDSCCCPDGGDCGAWIERPPWQGCCPKRPVCCSELEMKTSTDSEQAAIVRYEPVFDDDGNVVYKKIQDDEQECCVVEQECCEPDEIVEAPLPCCSRPQNLNARKPTKLLSLVPNQSESYNFQRPVVRQHGTACSVRSQAPRGTRFYGVSSFANEANAQKWPSGYEPRSGAAICGFLL
jgi:hypothetical protein